MNSSTAPPATANSAASDSDIPEKEVVPDTQQESQTAAEFIDNQLQLEADAREALPFTFDTCTQPFGPIRQSLFSCLTCNPPPSSLDEPYAAAGICYSCSISCHGKHTLVELFNKRNFVCDCGTTRLPKDSPCTLRISTVTGLKGGVYSEVPALSNKYDRNFRNVFCGCAKVYDATKERGTMFQCLGLASADEGGCGEDWWHPGCLVGLGENWDEVEGAEGTKKELGESVVKIENTEELSGSGINGPPAPILPEDALAAGVTTNPQSANPPSAVEEANEEEDEEDEEHPYPPGFPNEDDFESFICYKCVEAHPWIKRYAGTGGFLPPVYNTVPKPEPELTTLPTPTSQPPSTSNKRKAEDSSITPPPPPKRPATSARSLAPSPSPAPATCRYLSLPPAPTGRLSLFLTPAFRASLCHCASCFPLLAPHPALLDAEETYQPPLSEPSDGGGRSVGSRSLLDRGEAALSTMDRVVAIEGVLAYNAFKEQLKTFLQPFAASGRVVEAEDIKRCFEQIRGDAEAVKEERVKAGERGGGV